MPVHEPGFTGGKDHLSGHGGAGEALAVFMAFRTELAPVVPDSALHLLTRLDQIQGLLAGLASGTGRPGAGRDVPYAGLAPWQLRAVERRIEQSLGGRLRLEDLAAEARLSARHFGRAFKRATGHSPHAFLTRRRLERACRLMLETNLSLAEVANACGLSDQAHLARLFRQHYQQTPRRWRWENRLQQADGVVAADRGPQSPLREVQAPGAWT